ncbi:MAG: hypothetical protein H6797_03225 [Candidatus Nomurabacteria bacterium]|nr:MAG: hypothetical protein H6797_03225 [Candidatus Nomurabacteria bacterium]
MKNNKSLNFFKNKNGEWTIAQFPNFPIIAWLLLYISLFFIGDSNLKSSVHSLSNAFLFTWAYLEIAMGDSGFRRLLGGVVILSVIYGYFN